MKTMITDSPSPRAIPDADMLTVEEAAGRLKVSKRTLEREMAAGRFRRPVTIRGSSRVHIDDLTEYIAQLRKERDAALLRCG
jgi:excisionase family DNA binding protein